MNAAAPIPFHALSNLFPLLEGKANGLVEPIVVFEEKILDGRELHVLGCRSWASREDYPHQKAG